MEEKKEVSFSKPKSKSKDQDSLEELKKISLFNIGPIGYQKILDAGLDMNHFFLIHLCFKNEMIYTDKHQLMMLKLLRKQYITEDWKITILGKDLYKSVSEDHENVNITTKINDSGFDLWWKTYPGTDDFEIKGVSFKGSRSLKSNKKLCKIRFSAIINEGEYNEEEMIKALELEVDMKKEQSLQTRSNKLTYMQLSTTYLNQRSFESFVEMVRSKSKDKKKDTGNSNIMLV